MIIRQHQKGDAASRATYSPDARYRYALTRDWAPGPRVLFVMLNPSTATEVQNDPTVERCERRSRALGYGGFAVANIFAFRATDPRVMRAEPDPVGPANDATILDLATACDRIICAWGSHGAHLDRGTRVDGAFARNRARSFPPWPDAGGPAQASACISATTSNRVSGPEAALHAACNVTSDAFSPAPPRTWATGMPSSNTTASAEPSSDWMLTSGSAW